MNSYANYLRLIALAVLIANLVGCATSESDLGYQRQGPESTSSDDAHGWGGGPVPVSQ